MLNVLHNGTFYYDKDDFTIQPWNFNHHLAKFSKFKSIVIFKKVYNKNAWHVKQDHQLPAMLYTRITSQNQYGSSNFSLGLPLSVLSSSILEQDCDISEYDAVISLIRSSSSSEFSVSGDLLGLHAGVDKNGLKGLVGVVIARQVAKPGNGWFRIREIV